MKGSVPCKCDRGERQRTEDEHAALLGKQARKVSHMPSCPIVQLHRLNEVKHKLDAQDAQPTFDEAVCLLLDAERRKELQREELRLLRSLKSHGVDVTTTSEVASTA
jgi:hypothetical protein